jgi:tRNA pseudouridine55 synthase
VSPDPPPPEGLLLVDKPGGITSHDAIDRVRRVLGTRKVGHAGTLDPMATGLLLVGVGRATRLLRFLGDLEKTYEGTARLGMETDTLDADGEVLRTAEVADSVTPAAIRTAMAGLEGGSLQRPPAYSAVKVGGRKLVDAARSGETLEATERPIHVRSFELVRAAGADLEFRVSCSSGTYVRVLLADVGRALGCGAHLTRLRRTAIGPFVVADAGAPDDPGDLLPVDRAVAHLPRLVLEPEEAVAAGHGRVLGPLGVAGPYAVYSPEERLIGVYEDDGGRARPQVILAPSATEGQRG